MSTILKALKKSEAERRLGRTPRLDDLPPSDNAPASSHGADRPVIAALLCIGLLLAAYLLWPEPLPEAPKVPTQSVAQATLPARSRQAGPPATPASATGKTDVEESVVPPETPDRRPQPTASPAPPATASENATGSPSTAASASTPETPATAPAEPSDTSTTADSGPTAEEEDEATRTLPEYTLLPRYRTLADARKNQLPPLTLNVLMFAEQPERRFVLINLERYGEGDDITEELRIVAIFEHGVVLEDSQGRFVLPRP